MLTGVCPVAVPFNVNEYIPFGITPPIALTVKTGLFVFCPPKLNLK